MMALDSAGFREFKSKREQWIECLNGKDYHSIMSQISWMLWNAGAYQVINEARRIAEPAAEGGIQLNGTMHRLIDDGFFVSQAVAIRRLTDTYGLTGERGVYSLTGLLNDMRANCHLMTRAHILAADGLDYDPEVVEEAYRQYCTEQRRAGKDAYFVPDGLDSHLVKERHKTIDRLAGVNQANRSRDDHIRPEIFDHLREKVTSVCDKVIEYVNKYVAHAATPTSRAAAEADGVGLNLSRLDDAHEAICKVAGFVDLHLLTETSHSFLPTPQFNQFAYIDRPLVTEENIGHLAEEWDKYDKETREWSDWGLNELEAEMQ